MRYPEFLKDNDTIGFIAPSFGCGTEPYRTCFEEAQRVFRKGQERERLYRDLRLFEKE